MLIACTRRPIVTVLTLLRATTDFIYPPSAGSTHRKRVPLVGMSILGCTLDAAHRGSA